MPNFVEIGQSVAKILRFFDFSRWRLPIYGIDQFAQLYWWTVSGERRRITVPNFIILLRRYCDFSNFQNGHRHHLGFLKSQNFIDYLGGEGPDASACQISSKLVAKVLRFFDFSRWRLTPPWIVEFAKFHWLTVFRGPRRIIVLNFVIPLLRYCDFLNFQNGCRLHLGFLNSQNFIGYLVERVETHQNTKFRQNRSFGYKDIKIF